MAEEQAKIDQNYRRAIIAITDDLLEEIRNLIVDPVTKRLKVQATVSGNPVFDNVTINDWIDLAEWKPSFDYEIGNVVVANNGVSNNLYQATADHTSTANFNDDIANWELISTGSGGSLTINTSNFNRVLSALDNTPQKAFDTLDNEVAGINISNTFSQAQEFTAGIEDGDTTIPIKIAEAGDGSFNTTKKSITGAVNELKGRVDTITNPLLYKGVINLPADFPTLAQVQTGWYYHISTDVTDNNPAKTNTGLSFIIGDDIAWNGSTWEKLGATSLWVRTGNTLQPANPNDNVNIGSGSYTGADVNITNLNSGIGIISSGAVKLSIQELDQAIYDQLNKGHVSWTGSGDYYSIQGAGSSAFFRLLRGGTVRFNGKLINFTAPQDAPASADNTLNYLYIDTNGVLQQTVNYSDAFNLGVPLFEMLDDGTNHIVVKENHPYSFDSSISIFIHGYFGVLIGNPTTGANIERVATGTGASAGDRELRIQGASELSDHGLNTTIPDTGASAFTINWVYKNASGKWERYLQQTQAPMVYNNAGVITALTTTTNGDVSLATIYVSKDDLNTSTPTYYGVIHNASVNTPAQAQAIINAGTNVQADNELAGLELAQLGTIVLQNNVSGGYIERRNISKKTVTTGTTVGSGSSVASGINLDTTNFDKVLSGSDTNVQVAMETLDELGNQLTTNYLRARTSAGIQMLNNSGAVIAIFGAGGGLGVGFNNGITVANSGAFNTGFGDYDFTINKLGAGTAFVYDAGLDQIQVGSYITSTQDINIATGKKYKINGVDLAGSDIGLGNVTNDAQLKRASGDFNTFTTKPSLSSSDIALIEDSDASFAKKKVTIGDMGTKILIGENQLENSNFINVSTSGYGSTPELWEVYNKAYQGGFPTFTKQKILNTLGISDSELEGLWNLNEASGNAIDLSSNNLTLTDVSFPVVQNYLMSYSRKSTVNNQFLNTTSISNLLPGSGLLWGLNFRYGQLNKDGELIGFDNGVGSLHYLKVVSNKIVFGLNGLSASLTSDVILEQDKSYHIVAGYASNTLYLWINGILKTTSVTGSINNTGLVRFTIGAGLTSGTCFGTYQNVFITSAFRETPSIKALWYENGYKGVKLLRDTDDSAIYQDIGDKRTGVFRIGTNTNIERFKGKTLTMVADVYATKANTARIIVFDGVTFPWSDYAPINTWTRLSSKITVSDSALYIRSQISVVDTVANEAQCWVKNVMLYEGDTPVAFWDASKNDWSRFPRLMRMDPPADINGGYHFEENRVYTYSSTLTGFSSVSNNAMTYSFNGKNSRLTFRNLAGVSNATSFTATIPILSSSSNDITYFPVFITDNGSTSTTMGYGQLTASSNSISFFKSFASGAWTASGNKDVFGSGLNIRID